MPLTAEQVLETLRLHAPQLREFGLQRIGLFGSVARGEATADSDLDFIVELSRHTLDDYLGLADYLEALFETKVDLTELGALPEHYLQYVLPDVKYAADIQS